MTNPVAAWAFDETAGPTLDDAIGSADLTLGANGFLAAGKNSRAVFPTAIGAPSAQGAISLSGLTKLTIMGWVKIQHTGSYASMLSLYDGGAGGTQRVRIGRGGSNALHFELTPASSKAWVFSADNSLNTTTWKHIAARWNFTGSGGLALFIDGVEVSVSATGTGNIGGLLTVDTLILGDPAVGTAGWDDLRIFNDALDVTEIASYMNSPVSAAPASLTLAGAMPAFTAQLDAATPPQLVLAGAMPELSAQVGVQTIVGTVLAGAYPAPTATFDLDAVPNDAPTANAGIDRSIVVGQTITLNGSSSSDPDGTIVDYEWTKLTGPAATLSGSGATRSFTPTIAGTYVFGLVVTDNLGAISGTDTMTVTVAELPDGGPTLGGVSGGYLRHRPRMVQESVYQDLRDTLIACRWLEGTTERPAISPYDAGSWENVTTSEGQTLRLLKGDPINLIDYFPEAEQNPQVGKPTTGKTPPNTFAMDNGTAIETAAVELGSTAELVTYRFNMAFYAASDAVAQAVLSDLTDRYKGRLVRPEVIELWNFNDPEAEAPVNRMAVESFAWTQNTDPSIAPHEVHLYFAELVLEDEVD